MRVIYHPVGEKIWLATLVQSGRGLGAYSGERLQRGYGLGAVFGSLLRSILPVAKSVGKQALRSSAEVAQDYLQGGNIGQSIQTRGRQGARRLVAKGVARVLNNQKGKGFGVRPKGKAKGIKGLTKPKKSTISKKKRKTREDALGLY